MAKSPVTLRTATLCITASSDRALVSSPCLMYPMRGTGKGQGTAVLYEGGLNSRGETCGFYLDSTGNVFCFLRQRSGVITTFDPLDSTLCFPTWIYDGRVTTGCTLANGSFHGFIRKPNGALKTFDVPDPNLGAFGTQPNSINAFGVIAESSETRPLSPMVLSGRWTERFADSMPQVLARCLDRTRVQPLKA
jgi:hypothetical protein